MGTTISAGSQSLGLVETHQRTAFPYLFAHQVGAPFTYPAISPGGYPPLLRLVSLKPLVITNLGVTPGVPTNLAQTTAYNNMGIPGALILDAADSTNYYANPFGRDTQIFQWIVRHRGTVLTEVASLAPTFVSVEYGANELLGAALRGSGAPLLDSPTFAGVLTATMNGLAKAAPQARFAIFNVPDVTSLPYVTTFSRVVLGADGKPVLVGGVPIPLIGLETGSPGPLAAGDHVLLGAADSLAIGVGFPLGTFSYLTGAPGTGRPLPDAMVLSAAEVAQLQGVLANYNRAIDSVATGRGGALVDLKGLVAAAASAGGISYQGTRYTSQFITGGLFSLDGVHPNDLGQGILANTMIDAVNLKFGSGIPHVDLSAVASATSSRVRPTGLAGALPWIEDAGEDYARMFPWHRGSAP
jgi:hypothetical protein